ncbi:MAG: UDP-3-O-(3-hydroxymyristoyl)glucosamine N-acyltransferase [Deltaproteobacteria bacterium RBG_16_49_23]|nr:MAG: UDP-3-O-(3-hydroxymyristoyl)glucosamine N-acyltransferase [Deltaproteobacteria bacterium RBG_16_49_23]
MKRKLNELAEYVGGTLVGDGEVEISGVASMDEAQPGEITFIASPRYLRKLNETRASAVIVSKEVTAADKPLICAAHPHLAFVKILTLFFAKPYQPKGIDPNAWISSTAQLGKDLTIYPHVYIGDRCRIEDRVTLYPGVAVGEDSVIGEDSVLHPNVSVYSGSVIGKRVILHSGVVVGADGFGFVKDGKKNVKIPQVGKVIIEDDVEVGANSTIDRAALGETIIRRGVKIDNLVQVAHNVEIGEDSIIVAQVGIAGSTKIGKNVILAGQVGVVGHIEIGDNVQVGAQSGVGQNLPPDQAFSGSPAMPHREWLRTVMTFPKLPEMRRTLVDIEGRLKKIEEAISLKEKEK